MNVILKNKIGAMFMTGVPKDALREQFVNICKEYRIGHFDVSADNAITVDSVCELTTLLRDMVYNYSGTYPIICIDQEGGWVTRFYCGGASIAGPMSYAASGADSQKMYEVGSRLGKMLRAVGCNAVDSPVLDVNMDPRNPIIGTRSYSDDPKVVTELGVAFARGLENAGTMSAVKHFPGHGNVCADTHTGMAVNNESLETLKSTEFTTFQAAFDNGIGAIMTAHVTYPAISDMPATLSKEIMTDLIRKDMHFDGVIITDSMGMEAVNATYPDGEAAVLAIEAGCDIVLYYPYNEKLLTEAVEAVYKAVESGRISEDRINESYNRIMRKKEKYHVADAQPDLALSNELIYNKDVINTIFAEKIASITCMKNDGVLDELSSKKIICISPVCEALRGVEEKMRKTLSFADTFANEFMAEACISSLSGITPEVLTAIESDFDVAVVGIFDAASMPEQLAIIKELKKTGKPIVAVLLRSPYDYKYVSDCNAVVTCYEYTTLSINALVRAMKNNEYKGKLPVCVDE